METIDEFFKSTNRDDFFLGIELLYQEKPELFDYENNRTMIPAKLCNYLDSYFGENYKIFKNYDYLGEVRDYIVERKYYTNGNNRFT